MKNTLIYLLKMLEGLVFKKRDDQSFIDSIPDEYVFKKCQEQNFNEISTLLSYKDQKVKSLIWEIKYHRNKKALEIASKIIFEAIKDDLYEKEIFEKREYVLVNIPITKNKLSLKGFCHTEVLCKEILELCAKDDFLNKKISYDPNILIKIKDTKPQSHTKSKEERFLNLKDCFEIKNITNKNIILIDDVVTTGTTIKEAVLTLKKNGMDKISCYTLAH